jgi:hypothetical protein
MSTFAFDFELDVAGYEPVEFNASDSRNKAIVLVSVALILLCVGV